MNVCEIEGKKRENKMSAYLEARLLSNVHHAFLPELRKLPVILALHGSAISEHRQRRPFSSANKKEHKIHV